MKIGSVIEASVAEINTEIAVGRVQPWVIGFPGEDDRAPHWDLKATGYPIEGTHTFWLVLAQPIGCTGIQLYTRAYGEIQTSWGSVPVPVRPKQQAWGNRPSFLIR